MKSIINARERGMCSFVNSMSELFKTAEDLVQSFQRLQRAAIRDAFGLREGE